MVKNAALAQARSRGPHDAQRAYEKAKIADELPQFTQDLRHDRHMDEVLARVRRQGLDDGSEFYKLTPGEEARLHALELPPLSKHEQERRRHASRKAMQRARDQDEAAKQLEAAGVRSPRPPHRPPVVKATPRANPNPWQDRHRQWFFAADRKVRQASEIAWLRDDWELRREQEAARTRLAAGRTGPSQSVLRPADLLGWDKERRREKFLPRSWSDQTKEVFDEQKEGAGGDHVARETGLRRGVPSDAAQVLKQEALHRSHTIGYRGEITDDNAASRMVNDYRSAFYAGPLEHHLSPGRAVPVPVFWDDLMDEGPAF